MKNISDKLTELWQDHAAQQAVPVQQAEEKKEAKLKAEFKFLDPIHCFRCNIANCVECCCKRKGQKIRLLLLDLAVLLDNGYADMIEGKYGSKKEVEKFSKDPKPENIYKAPYLKRKAGDECIFLTKDLECSIWAKAPFICRTYPLILDQKTKENKLVLSFSLDKLCSCTAPEQLKESAPKEYTQRIMNDIIAERIEADRTTKLLFHKRAELKKMGFAEYL